MLFLKKIWRIIRNFLSGFILIKRVRHFVLVKLLMQKTLSKQLSEVPLSQPNLISNKKRVLVAMVELSHYQFLQVLVLAKALQLRGAEIRLLICDESLFGCEIKSIKNEKVKDRCWECRFNKKNIVSIFNLKTITYSDYLTSRDEEQITNLALENLKKGKNELKFGDLSLGKI